MEVEIPEVEVPPIEVETPLENPIVEDAVEAAPVEDAVVEETPEVEETVEASAETEAEPVDEPITFDHTVDAPTLIESIDPVLDRYELPDEVQAAFEALKAKAQTGVQEFAVYGDNEAVKTLLERQSYLDTAVETDNGYRPNTDKFVESLANPDVKQWLYYDLGRQPSDEMPGVSKFEETLVKLFAKDGEAPEDALGRYHKLVEYLQNDEMPVASRPTFIPDNLVKAYSKLSQQSQDELGLLDPTYEDDKPQIAARLRELEMIQKGIDSEEAYSRIEAQKRAQAEQAFTEEVIKTQNNMFTAFREQAIKDINAKVQFSTDPKLQALQTGQIVSIFSEALDPNGDFARQTLEQAGIQFDAVTAQALMKDIERCSVQLAAQNRAKTPDGRYLDPVSYNKAKNELDMVTRKWQSFANQNIEQLARLVSTGKAEDVKQEAAKIKVPLKARQVPKGSPSQAGKAEQPLPPMGDPRRLEIIAERELAEQAARAKAYA